MKKNIIPLFIPHKGCQMQCVFCNQRHITGSKTVTTEELEAEIVHQLHHAGHQPDIAFYGGTFTGLPMAEMVDLLNMAMGFVRKGYLSGIRFSTHPATLTEERIQVLKSYPISFMELGVQSFDEKVLEAAQRGCTRKQIDDAIALIQDYGIPFGLQLMLGLPMDTYGSFIYSVKESIKVRPQGIRLYPTVVLEDTALAQAYRQGRYVPLSLDESVEWCVEGLKLIMAECIPLLRVGLHATEDLLKGSHLLAGPFHPAFKELVQSEAIYRSLINWRTAHGSERVRIIEAHPSMLSSVSGQKGFNRQRLTHAFGWSFGLRANKERDPQQLVVFTDASEWSINLWS